MKSLAAAAVVVLLFLFVDTSFADDADVVTGIPFTEYDIVDDIVYGHKDGLALTLDVLTPKQNAKGIGVILVSSGSWMSGKSDLVEQRGRQLDNNHWTQGLLAGGFTVFAVRHSSSPRYFVPEMVEDLNRSVRYVRAIATDHGTDPNQLGMTGGSSGGHLALMAALTGDNGDPGAKDPIQRISSRVQCVVAWFPPTDMVNWRSDKGFSDNGLVRSGLLDRLFGEVTDLESRGREMSPVYHVNQESPPLLLLHGDQDELVPLRQSKVMQAKYDELGLSVKLIVEPGGGHAYWPEIMTGYQQVWPWFDEHLTK